MPASELGLKAIWATTLTADDTAAKEELGIIRFEVDRDDTVGLKSYRYVQVHADSAAVANGDVVVYRDLYKIVADTRIAQSTENHIAGVGIGVITAGNYGWLQIGGYHAVVKTNGDDDIADGDVLIHSGTDLQADSVAAGTAPTYIPVGVAVAADVDADNTVAAQLCVPV
jgi:hypothetical protein